MAAYLMCLAPMQQYTSLIAALPGLDAQLLLLAVRKAGEGLEGFIT